MTDIAKPTTSFKSRALMEWAVENAREQTIAMSPAHQLAFWNALQSPVTLTPALRRLSELMRDQD